MAATTWPAASSAGKVPLAAGGGTLAGAVRSAMGGCSGRPVEIGVDDVRSDLLQGRSREEPTSCPRAIRGEVSIGGDSARASTGDYAAGGDEIRFGTYAALPLSLARALSPRGACTRTAACST